MYEIKRENGRVVIYTTRNDVRQPIYNAPEDSYLIYDARGARQVNKIKDLPDDQLLFALSTAVPLNLS